MASYWFFREEARWRIAACATWTFLLNLCVVSAFLLVWLFSPLYHVVNICSYFSSLTSFYSWFLVTKIALTSAVYVKIHELSSSVVCRLECSRIELLPKYFFSRNLLYATCSSMICGFVTIMITNFSTQQLSAFVVCQTSRGTFSCLNEAYVIFLFFGFTTGFFHYLLSKMDHFYVLKFPPEQQSRFLTFKVNFTARVIFSAKQSFSYLKYFIVLYYIFGVFPRYLISTLTDYPFCDADLVGFNNFSTLISISWTLWIFGTLLLLLINLSWLLFSCYCTKVFMFPVDSVFPEDNVKLLTKNLNSNEPLIVQHLAFQWLSILSKYSASKRRQIYEVNFEKQGKRCLKWEIVANECLARIKELTENLKSYHQGLTGSKSHSDTSSKPQGSATQLAASSTSGVKTPLRSTTLKRRPLFDTTNISQANTSYFDASQLNASNYLNGTQLLDQSAFFNNSLTVPTPKLWTRNQKKNVTLSELNEDQEQYKIESPTMRARSLYAKLTSTIQQIPIIAYFFKKIPDRVMANNYSNHNVYKWAIESLSCLVAASIEEDQYGFVQQRINEVVAALLDLLAILEKSCKLPFVATSSSSAYLLRQQRVLKVATKSAIYKIVNAFAKYIDVISLNPEHRSRLQGFIEQRE